MPSTSKRLLNVGYCCTPSPTLSLPPGARALLLHALIYDRHRQSIAALSLGPLTMTSEHFATQLLFPKIQVFVRH